MVKRLVWKENDLLVLKLHKDLYTVCQLHKKGFIQFYNFFTDNPKIKGVDFNEIEPLYYGAVITASIAMFAHSKITKDNMPKQNIEWPTLWITRVDVNGLYGHPPLSEDNVLCYIMEFPPYNVAESSGRNPILVRKDSSEILDKYELINYKVDTAYRLYCCYKESRNIDYTKEVYLKLGNKTESEHISIQRQHFYEIAPYIPSLDQEKYTPNR